MSSLSDPSQIFVLIVFKSFTHDPACLSFMILLFIYDPARVSDYILILLLVSIHDSTQDILSCSC
jgi:hypothetical protein